MGAHATPKQQQTDLWRQPHIEAVVLRMAHEQRGVEPGLGSLDRLAPGVVPPVTRGHEADTMSCTRLTLPPRRDEQHNHVCANRQHWLLSIVTKLVCPWHCSHPQTPYQCQDLVHLERLSTLVWLVRRRGASPQRQCECPPRVPQRLELNQRARHLVVRACAGRSRPGWMLAPRSLGKDAKHEW